MIDILVTAAGSPGFITMCKALRACPYKMTVHGCDMSKAATGLSFADHSFVAPHGKETNYIDHIFDYCKKYKITHVFPGSDEELLPLSKNKSKFEKIGCKILVSNPDSLEIVLNKFSLYENLKQQKDYLNILPEYRLCSNIDEFEKAYAYLISLGHDVCIKPVEAHGSRGYRRICRSKDQSSFFNEKPNARDITLDEIRKILSQNNGKFPNLLAMEHMPGDEYSVDCIQTKNKFVAVTRRRDIIKEGICSAGEAIKKEDLLSLVSLLYNHFEFQHNINFQFRYTSTGIPKLLEINPRISGTLELCRGAGINFIHLGLADLLNPDDVIVPSIKWGTKMIRMWEEIFTYDNKNFVLADIKDVISHRGKGN